MAEIEITLPTVQFGNVKVRATPEELGVDISSPSSVGTATAIYLNLFTQGFKLGASLDVTASPTEGLSAPSGRSVDQVMSDEDVDTVAEAQAILDKELGGVTEVVVVDEPGDPLGRHLEEAPWNSMVAPQAKPWENGNSAPAKVAEIDW